MTLERSSTNPAFASEPAPMGDLAAVKGWAAAMFDAIARALAQPRPQSVMLSLLQPGDPAFAKPVDGLLVFAAATATGPGNPQGVYIRTGGAWVQL